MKKVLYIIIIVQLVFACGETEDFTYDNSVDAGNVKLIKLKADHKMLLPDGKAVMKFYAEAYNILELPNYTPSYDGDNAVYVGGIVRDTSLIPNDLLPHGLFKLVDEFGQEYPDFCFSTEDPEERTVRFHLEVGELISNELGITIRSLPQEDYDTLVIPVVFHVLNPAKQASIVPIKITPELIYKNIERLNNVFNGKITTDPNGGCAKIVFRPAIYNDNGIKMDSPGYHSYEIPSSVTFEKDDDYLEYVFSKQGALMYSFNNYLNIWLINNPQGAASIVRAPTDIDRNAEPIPGLDAQISPKPFPAKATDIGFFINMSYFINPMRQTDYFEISEVMARYLGLLTTQVIEGYGQTNFIDGDTDYCEDTPYYWKDNFSVFKNTSKNDIEEPGTLYFTSYNVMDRYSYKNSISRDQIRRIRMHLERCPSRWMYKSKFAFTGKSEDKR